MRKEALIQRKKQRIKSHNDKTNDVYYECYNCNKRYKVDKCPKCGKKLKGAYCKRIPTITSCSLPLLGEDGDI